MIPKELQILIYEFDPNHRIRFNPSLKQIPIKGTQSRLNKIENICDEQVFEDGNWDFETVFKKHINDPLHILKTLSQCKCCTRHQLRCPRKFQGQTFRHKTNSENLCINAFNCMKPSQICLCKCRHITRFIVNSFTPEFHNFEYSATWANDD